jgi:hypothetical protein
VRKSAPGFVGTITFFDIVFAKLDFKLIGFSRFSLRKVDGVVALASVKGVVLAVLRVGFMFEFGE